MTSPVEISDTLGRLHQVLRRAAARYNGTDLLPDAQLAVLRLVESRPGIRVRDVAEALRTAPNTISTLVGELAGAGLLTRERVPENRRQVRLTLTAEAHDRIARYHARRRELVTDALDQLGAEARDRITAALPDLRRLADLLAAAPPPAAPPAAPPQSRPAATPPAGSPPAASLPAATPPAGSPQGETGVLPGGSRSGA